MNWEAIGAVGEVIGAVAVLVTLLYLSTQIRQANEISRYNGAKEVINQFNVLNAMVANNHSLRACLLKHGELDEDEQEQIYNFAIMFCNVWLSSQAAHNDGQLDEILYAAAAKDVHVELERWPNFHVGAERWLENYPEHQVHAIFRPILDRMQQRGGR
jgi:hypothetical protein